MHLHRLEDYQRGLQHCFDLRWLRYRSKHLPVSNSDTRPVWHNLDCYTSRPKQPHWFCSVRVIPLNDFLDIIYFIT